MFVGGRRFGGICSKVIVMTGKWKCIVKLPKIEKLEHLLFNTLYLNVYY